jgi:DNA-directed RNA polymerase sigma subunit (sigma70/sigma32)
VSPEPTDPLRNYLRVVESIPPLAPQEERRLWPSVKRNDDDLARKRLLEGSLHLVTPIARRYEGRGTLLIDLIQRGNIGLVRAVELFDPSEGGAFSSFAGRHIQAAIVKAIH